jgi:hypothetical protein
VVNASPVVSADAPGALRAEIEQVVGFPCVLLQGAAGDTNPTLVAEDPAALADWQTAVRRLLRSSPPKPIHAASTPCLLAVGNVEIGLDRPADPALLRGELQQLDRVHRGESDDWRVNPVVTALANVLNLPQVAEDNLPLVRYAAGAFAASTRASLEYAIEDHKSAVRGVALAALRVGAINLAFVAVEPFAATAFRLAASVSPSIVSLIGYLGPVVGYLPDDAAMLDGGYEVDYAWRFYGAPAPFVVGSEARVVSALAELVEALGARDANTVV